MARSFHGVDDATVAPIVELLDSFAPLGLVWETAERAEIESVSKKVQQKIDNCDVFVGVFTRRHPIFSPDFDKWKAAIEPDAQPIGWTGPPWLFQESGYALKAGKKLLLIREANVELPALQGDLEYIDYNPEQPQIAWKKAHQVLTQLIAQNVGLAVEHLVSGPEPKTTEQDLTESAEVLLSEPSDQAAIDKCFDDLLAAAERKDFDAADRAQEEGARLIKAGDENFEEVSWKSMCLAVRGRAGEISAINCLSDLSADNPVHWAPLQALANIARAFGDYKSSGDCAQRRLKTDRAPLAYASRQRETSAPPSSGSLR